VRHLPVLITLCLLQGPLRAADPGTVVQAAAAARQCAPGLVRAGKGIVEVPLQVAQCLRLPLGLVETVFSPLPGVGLADGLKDTGAGLVAPFKLCIAVLKMPYEVFCGVGDALVAPVR